MPAVWLWAFFYSMYRNPSICTVSINLVCCNRQIFKKLFTFLYKYTIIGMIGFLQADEHGVKAV